MKSDKGIVKGIVMITQIGISVLVPIFLCLFVGKWLDGLFHTSYITLIGIALGIITAFRNIYKLTKQFYAKDKANEDAHLKYLADMTLEREAKLKQSQGDTTCKRENKPL